MKAAIVGLAGPVLDADEAILFRRHRPAGAILFARNVWDPEQLAALTASLREVLPAHAVIAVDQEGGRVARLRPPHWRIHPAAARIGELDDRDPAAGERAAWLTGALIGLDCAAAGFDVACAPVLDVRVPGAHEVVGDRAFSSDPDVVARLGRAMADGLLAAGVQPVAKHAPGHGRATVDSHLDLPRVGAAQDLTADMRPFALCAALPWMMTAHILYEGLDADWPATLSAAVIRTIIRGRIGFQGVLVSDDLAMNALTGSPGERAARAVGAGCDLALHCSGVLPETADALAGCPDITEATLGRLAAARGMAAQALRPLDGAALADERDALLGWQASA
jgi:beta-N-acetylhexosaminidase